MNLLVVESPNKVAKIRGFLGPGWQVAASFGHVADLPPDGDLGVRFHNGTVEPQYRPLAKAERAIAELRRLAQHAQEVWIATDPDREGEAIGWHVARLLNVEASCRRVAFQQITAAAVQAAVAKPRRLDRNLIDAQQARRVLDRVVGWLVSPALRRSLRDKAARSAGRVQSAALRLVAERERAIAAHHQRTYFCLDADLEAPEQPPLFTARLVAWKGEPLEQRLADRETAEKTADWCRRQVWQVLTRDEREQTRQPPAPFTTATVQQAASVRLKLTPDATMKQLQSLFEGGHITYHRTDSVALAPEAIAAIRLLISERFPAAYLPAKPVQHSGKANHAQEAHEAIRPTHLEREGVAGDVDALYRLIRERAIASQMAAARDRHVVLSVAIAPAAWQHPERGLVPMGVAEARSRSVLFDGWRRAGDDATEERRKQAKDELDESRPLPEVTPGQQLELRDLRVIERSTQPPRRFTQAALIKELERLGIGRPSTYAAILHVLLQREYVIEHKRVLHCPELGLRMCDWLLRHFGDDFLDLAYTARLEEDLDRIARGELPWEATVTTAAERIRDRARAAGLDHDPLIGEAPPQRRPPSPAPEAGPCPLCGAGLERRHGPYGDYYGCSQRGCPAILRLDKSPNRRTAELLSGAKTSEIPEKPPKKPRAKRAKPSGENPPAAKPRRRGPKAP